MQNRAALLTVWRDDVEARRGAGQVAFGDGKERRGPNGTVLQFEQGLLVTLFELQRLRIRRTSAALSQQFRELACWMAGVWKLL
jgi:hypothetical protein